MDVRKKIGLLYNQGSLSAKEASAAPDATHAPGSGDKEAGDQHQTKRDRAQAALKLWRDWATDALGPLTSEPTFEELHQRKKKIKGLERKCAELAARAQRRLQVSSALRTTSSLLLPGGSAGATHSPQVAAALAAVTSGSRPSSASGSFSRESLWAARERRRSSAYESVKVAGAAERAGVMSGGHGDQHHQHNPDPSAQAYANDREYAQPPALNSRSMLNSIMAQAAAAAADRASSSGAPRAMTPGPARAAADQHQHTTLSAHAGDYHQGPIGSLSRASSWASQAHTGVQAGMMMPGARSALRHSSVRPRSASPALPGGYGPGSPTTGRTSVGGSPGQQGRGVVTVGGPDVMGELQAEVVSLKTQLDEARHAVQSQTELEAQLRDTIDMLRARTHAQSSRELEHVRRLQQHVRLEPIFDRLAEAFVFKSPEEVIERLELLEDDKLGSFDQLLRTQEEVAALQQKLSAAQQRVEEVRTSLSTEHIGATARLQQRNQELIAEVEEMQHLNNRLMERQRKMVSLTTAVLDLWGRCQADPTFVKANSMKENGSGGEDEGSMIGAGPAGDTLDPEAILALVQEYLIAKSPQMASRRYLDVQRVANRVWLQHFQHKLNLRGKALETFEALSNLAEIMAAKIRTIQDQLERSRSTQRGLEDSLQKLEVQKRVLQVQLERRDTLVRDMAGVPRAERPHSASRYLDVATSDTVGFGPEARSSAAAAGAAGGQDAGGQRPRPQSAQSWRSGSMSQRQSLSGGQQRGPSNSGAGSQTPRGMSGAHHTSSLSGTSRGPSVDGRVVTRVRPGSAPASRLQPQQGTGAVAGLPASLLPQPIMEGSGMVGPMAMVRGPEPSTTSTPSSRPTSAVLPRGGLAQAAVAPLQSAGSAVKLVGRSGAPSGQHVQAQGASCASAAAATGGATRWVPPSRSQIESSFLQRLTRAAT